MISENEHICIDIRSIQDENGPGKTSLPHENNHYWCAAFEPIRIEKVVFYVIVSMRYTPTPYIICI